MTDIAHNLQAVKAELPPSVRLVAVSKYQPMESIEEAYACGHRVFGESKAQELVAKQEALPKDIEWHFIGHLQSNKIKYIAPFISLIHSVDSYKLLTEIDRQAEKCGRVIPCLLQMHIATEETKFGFSEEECTEMLQAGEWRTLSHVSICGLMGMASNVDDEKQIRAEFETLHSYYNKVKEEYFSQDPAFKELSMGMSHDYPIAIQAGASLVRVGSKIFGDRVYK